jgi:hypothetical protein
MLGGGYDLLHQTSAALQPYELPLLNVHVPVAEGCPRLGLVLIALGYRPNYSSAASNTSGHCTRMRLATSFAVAEFSECVA